MVVGATANLARRSRKTGERPPWASTDRGPPGLRQRNEVAQRKLTADAAQRLGAAAYRDRLSRGEGREPAVSYRGGLPTAVPLPQRGGNVQSGVDLRTDRWALGSQAAGSALFSKLIGDFCPKAEWRRCGLYQPSMKSKTAILASA